MYSDGRGNGQKPLRTKPSRRMTPDKPPGQNPPEQLREFVEEVFVRVFVLGRLKNGGPRCVTHFWGIPGCVTKCDRGRGSKLAKNSVTYFMDGRYLVKTYLII